MTDAVAAGAAVAFAADCDFELKTMRQQLKALGAMTGRKVELLRDLSDFFVKQAEIEQAYAKGLEHLASKFAKPRSERSAVANLGKALRRPSTMPGSDAYDDDSTAAAQLCTEPTGLARDVWAVLVEQAKRRAEARQRFASHLLEEMKQRLDVLEKETLVASKRCLELGTTLQSEMQRTFKATDDALKQYHHAQSKCLRKEDELNKLKVKGNLKKSEQIKEKLQSSDIKATQARNEYALCLTSANALKRRYYKMDFGNLIDTMNMHFHDSFKYIFRLYRDLTMQAQVRMEKSVNTVQEAADMVDPQKDKLDFVQENQVILATPKQFDFVSFRDADPKDVVCPPDLTSELVVRYRELEAAAAKLDYQIGEEQKTLNTIYGLRKETGATIQLSEDGTPKSVENLNMYTETYARLALKRSQRSALAAQLKQLGQALGRNRPTTGEHEKEYLEDEKENALPEPNEDAIKEAQMEREEYRRTSAARRLTTNANDPGETKPPTADAKTESTTDPERDGSPVSRSSSISTHEEEAPVPAVRKAPMPPTEAVGTTSVSDSAPAEPNTNSPRGERRRAPSVPSLPLPAVIPAAGTPELADSPAPSSNADDKPTAPPPRKKLGEVGRINSQPKTVGVVASAPASAPATTAKPAPSGAGPVAPTPAARKPKPPPAKPPPARPSMSEPAAAPAAEPSPAKPPVAAKIKPPAPIPAERKPSTSQPPASPAAATSSAPAPPVLPQYKFGGTLSAVQEATGEAIPLVVASCIKCIKANGLAVEGIFRVPGSQTQVDELKAAFEKGLDPLADGLPAHIQSTAVAGCLKLYLRQLEIPLMTKDHYRTFVQVGAIKDQEQRLVALREAVARFLPDAHRQVLAAVVGLLTDVVRQEKKNLMGVSNLALVFGPTLMPAPKDDPGAMMRDAVNINALTSDLIQHYDRIFGEAPPEAKPEVVAEAVAKFDYAARNDTELSFKQGDRLQVFTHDDATWYTGEFNGKMGFIAAAYVQLVAVGEVLAEEKPVEMDAEVGTESLPSAGGTADLNSQFAPPIRRASVPSALAVGKSGGGAANSAVEPSSPGVMTKASSVPVNISPPRPAEPNPFANNPFGPSGVASSPSKLNLRDRAEATGESNDDDEKPLEDVDVEVAPGPLGNLRITPGSSMALLNKPPPLMDASLVPPSSPRRAAAAADDDRGKSPVHTPPPPPPPAAASGNPNSALDVPPTRKWATGKTTLRPDGYDDESARSIPRSSSFGPSFAPPPPPPPAVNDADGDDSGEATAVASRSDLPPPMDELLPPPPTAGLDGADDEDLPPPPPPAF